MLAPYAIKKTRGRLYEEKEDPFRPPFERDRNRIIHSKAFRRLAGKTQVFVATFGDHYRDRMTHTLEVSQIARDISRRLNLNEDLVEAISLAHDLGHPPFAHAGQEELDNIMRKFNLHFEHNEQSKRIVETLEDHYPDFPGLNLTFEVLDGLAKHQTHYDQYGRKISAKTLEAQAADLADEIAYHNHDLDDGFRSRLFSLKELRKLALWNKAEKELKKKEFGGNGSAQEKHTKYLRYLGIAHIIAAMIKDVCETTMLNIKKHRVRSVDDVLEFKEPLLGFSPSFQKEVDELRRFLWKKMYRSREVMKHSRHGQKVIHALFYAFYKNPRLLPGKLRLFPAKPDGKNGNPLVIIIKDYIAGMTDAFALALFKRITK